MKSVPVIILLLAAIVVATVLHVHKNNGQADDVDKMASGLSGVDQFLPIHSRLSVRLFDVPGEFGLYCRYLLAPRYISYKGEFDTVLSICDIHTSDSTKNSITARGRTIWAGSDQQHIYYLTSNAK